MHIPAKTPNLALYQAKACGLSKGFLDRPVNREEAIQLRQTLADALPTNDPEHPLLMAFEKDFYKDAHGRFTALAFWCQAHHLAKDYPEAVAALASHLLDME